MASPRSKSLRYAILMLFVMVSWSYGVAEAGEEIFEAGGYRAIINFPEFRLHAIFPNGSIYEEQYILITLDSIHEGIAVEGSGAPSFTPYKQFDAAALTENVTVARWSDTALLSEGNVTANRQVLSFSTTLYDGGNFTINFESYDADGTMPWGPRYVNISSKRMKWSAYASNWTFGGADRRLRATITGTYVTGTYDVALPTFEKIDWSGPTRRVDVTWPQIGPLSASLSSDVWAVGDGVASSMLLKPNPTTDLGSIQINNGAAPKSMSCTFGYILPSFTELAEWDPSVLMSLFTPEVNPEEPTPKDTFSNNTAIIAGSVVAAAVVATAAAALTMYKVKNYRQNKQSRAINHSM